MASILLVEDASDIRSIVELLLEQVGHTVVSVADGLSALRVAAREQPDLVVMDLALPGLNGWQATQQLKANAATRHIPVLAFTAHVLPDEIERAIAAGCAAVITKPFEIETFLEEIARLLHGADQPIHARAVGSEGRQER
jgi:two-component system, cell cycle response regulator DivK